MTKKELYTMDFETAIEKLYEEKNEITFYDTLKTFIKEQINKDNIGFAIHLLQGIWDTDCGDSKYYKYDYSAGTYDTPKALNTLEDLEQFCKD